MGLPLAIIDAGGAASELGIAGLELSLLHNHREHLGMMLQAVDGAGG